MKPSRLLIAVAFVLLWCLPLTAAGADKFIDRPPSGTDEASLRCEGGIISTGDSARDVIERCGQPLDQGRMRNRHYDFWVYHFQDTAYVYYLAFLNDDLQRIYSVNCIKDDPYCE